MPHGLTLWKFFDMNRGTSHPSQEGPARKGFLVLLEVIDVYKGFAKGNTWLERLKRGLHLRSVGGDAGDCRAFGLRQEHVAAHLIGALERPDRGMIRFHGRDVFRFSEQEQAEFRNRHVGFVFQFHHLLPEFTALEMSCFQDSWRVGYSARSWERQRRY